MIDVHCHLNFHAFENDYDTVIKDAQKADVTTIINTGTSIESSNWAVELTRKYNNLFAIIGIHPHHADKLEPGWLEQLEKLAKQPKVVGIGEIGLDYYSYASNGVVEKKLQKEVFIKQIELAHKLKLPLQIHNRQAGEDVIDILKKHQDLLMDPPGMFHCFAGTKEVLREALSLGFYIGFDGNLTYKGLAKGETVQLSELATLTPLERLVTETDSPYLTPVPLRGSRNAPEHVILIGKALAKIKGVDFKIIDTKTSENAKKIFKL